MNWWTWGTWAGVTGWLGGAWAQPVTYDYGTNVYYEGDTVYYGDQPYATTAQYAAQAQQIATSVPAQQPADSDWLPLGVFAITQDGEPSGAQPTTFLQLTVSKQGILAGSLQDTKSNTTQSIEGMVDRESQRAAWTVVDQSWPIMETGVNNLTQDSAPALVHFEDGQTQQWLLVRLDAPKDAAGATGSAPASSLPPPAGGQ